MLEFSFLQCHLYQWKKRKRKVLNIEDKLNVVHDHLKNNVSVKLRSQIYGVRIQTVYGISKNKESLLHKVKKLKINISNTHNNFILTKPLLLIQQI